jgi:mRNA interferase HigB
MNVIKLRALKAFWTLHSDAERPLLDWFRFCRRARWQSIRDVRRAYPHADAVTVKSGRTATVFNIGGNKYRLVALIDYRCQRMLITHVLTHADYSRERWKEQL